MAMYIFTIRIYDYHKLYVLFTEIYKDKNIERRYKGKEDDRLGDEKWTEDFNIHCTII